MGRSFSGVQKTAILLLSFGEEISADIFKHLTEYEIKRIGTAMGRLGRLEESEVQDTIDEFYQILQQDKQFFYGGIDYTRKVLSGAFKGNEGEDLIDELDISGANLNSLDNIDAKTLAGFLRNEHPQTIALILSHLDAKKMSDTLKLMPEVLHTEILVRIANLDSINPELIEEVESVLKQEVAANTNFSMNRLGGSDHVANMLNLVDKQSEEEFLEALEEKDPELAEQIRQLMFVFDDLINLDDRGAQELIKEVPNENWMLSLRTASEGVRELIFKNMSDRAAKMLREDMEVMGAVKVSEVDGAQQEVLQIAKKLEEEGKLFFQVVVKFFLNH